MTDADAGGHKGPDCLNITIVRARNLKGQKGETLNAVVKVEFGEKTLGESAKVECSAETPAEFNHNTTLAIAPEDPFTIDELASHPVLLTVIEVLPKEKKQKEEKTQVLGHCTFGLLPLTKGETKFKATLVVHSIPGSPIENLPPEAPKPEVDVSVFINEPLQSEEQLHNSNLLTITAESLCSPPDSWSPGPQYVYSLGIPVPITGDKENPVVFPNGSLRAPATKEPVSKQKKWLYPGSAAGNSVNIEDSFISGDAVEDEDGDYKSKEDRDHRTTSEQDKNRVIWYSEKHCFMDPAACKTLQDRVAKNRYWPVEVVRIAQPTGGKGKKDDESGYGFHGVAYVNLAPLLYPGVKRVRGAYKLHAYSDSEVFEKTNHRGGIAEEAVRVTNYLLNRNAGSPFPKKGDKKDSKKASTMGMKPSDTGSEADGGSPVNVEGQQYVEAKSYIMLEIELARPLIPKREPEELAKRVAEYIPPRALLPKRTNGAEKSVEEYHQQLAQVAGLILDEFRELYGEELRKGDMSQTPAATEKRRQDLIYELNSSGKYFAFKEQLKHAVIKIVREKYLKTTNFADEKELQAFLNELYVYLVDQMHIGLSKALSLEDKTPVPEPLTDSAQLKHFAQEAEVNENFEWASKYYQERIARNKNDATCWFDYGTFCLYINDLTKAEECFKECISIDQKHLYGLLLYAIVCTMEEKHDAAETFFEAATALHPDSVLAWTLMGLYYDGINNEIGAEMAFLEANKLNVQEAAAAQRALREQEEKEVKQDEEPEKPLTADAPDSKAVVLPTPSSALDKSPRSSKQMEKKVSLTSSAIGKPKGSGSRSVTSVASGDRPNSRQVPSNPVTPQPDQESPVREPTPVPTSSIFMFCVNFLLEAKAMSFTERCLAHELLLPDGGPTMDYYLTHAQLKLQRKELEEAEESINQAIQIDFQNAEAWALLGHLKYLMGDTESARDCYERTLTFIGNPSETHSIYLRLASIYLHETKFQEAKNTFLMACKRSPSCVSWLGVGIACYRLDELSEAEDALSEANVLNNYDPEVWGYLSLVCLKTGRALEAEQSYKYALKLNLEDQDLLAELRQVQEEVGFGNPEL